MTTMQYMAAWGRNPNRRVAVRWRGLTWSEYRKFKFELQVSQSPTDVYIDIYRALLLQGPPPERCTAGVVEWIARKMMETNPFGGEYEDVAFSLKAKRDAQGYLDNAKALIAAIFRYSFEEMDSWDADTFFDRVAKAEFIAGNKLEPVDPDAKRKAMEKRKQRGHYLPTGNEPLTEEEAVKMKKKPLTELQQRALERRNENPYK